MSLPDVLTKFAEIIADEILHECVDDIDEAKFRMIRYHGHAIPDDIQCSPDGLLSVWWTDMRPKNLTNGQCPLYPTVILHAKFAVCWKDPDVKSKSIHVFYEQNDADSARLAWIAECVSHRLMDLTCENGAVTEDDDPTGFEFLTLTDKPSYLDASPGGPHW